MQKRLSFLILLFLVGGCVTSDEEGLPQQGPIPLIYDFSPLSGSVGTEVVISGMHFSEVPAENNVKFNDADAEVTEASISKLVVKVPIKARTGKISVTVKHITAITAKEFVVK